MGVKNEDSHLIEMEKEEDEDSKWKSLREKLKSVLSHIGLFVTLCLYTAIGGLIFKELEYPTEITRLVELDKMVREERETFVDSVTRAAYNRRYTNLTSVITSRLSVYEEAVQEAARGGVLTPLVGDVGPDSLARWTSHQAIFFASTVLTTIGYGNIAPVTPAGRLFCILFALIGIPLTLSVIADLGRLMAGRLPDMPEPRGVWGPLFTALVATTMLLLYIAVGGAVFILWEKDWDFFDGFYFCFVTMTTIGFGDLVPSAPKYMLFCVFYILVGLGLTSTIIELVRLQYARSWKQLQALAETLGKLAHDQSGADVQAELKKIMTVVSLGGKGKKLKDWEKAVKELTKEFNKPKAKPQIVQIIVYESSV